MNYEAVATYRHLGMFTDRRLVSPFRSIGPVLLGLLIWSGSVSKVQAQISELGAAANFAGLELNASDDFTISKSTTVINGNVGLVSNGTLNFSGGGVVTGVIDAGSGATLNLTGGSSATGGINEPDAGMPQIVTDAANAATFYAGLSATQSFSSITSSQTITGAGGLNVIDVNGVVNIGGGGNLTLTGNSSDQFVINVDAGGSTTDFTLGGGSNIVLNGVSASQVVFNLIGSGLELTTTGESDTSGVFLAENGSITISGGVQNSDFISGGALTFQSGPNITQVAALAPVPELNPTLMAACALVLIAVLARVSRPRMAAC